MSVALERSSYNDEWSQTSSGWKRAKIEDDNQQEFDPRSARHGDPEGRRQSRRLRGARQGKTV